MKSKQILVIGHYRSGTSMLGGILHHLGVDMGAIGTDGDRWNKKGYFENNNFTCINNELRIAIPFKPKVNFLNNKPEFWKLINPQLLKMYRKRIEVLINQNNKNKSLWGIKDPRLPPFYELYLPFFDNVYVIIIKRDRDSIISSLQKKSHNERQLIDENIRTYQKIFKEIEKKTRCLQLEYKQVVNNPKNEIQKICDFIGEELTEEAVNFVDKNLKNY